MLIKERVIVLKKLSYSESDLIIRGLNPKGCLLSFIAKGALKSRKRFSGGLLDPTAYIGLEYRPSKSSLHFIQQAWFLEDFSALRQSYHRLNLALYFLKAVNQVCQEGTEDSKELFHLLGNALLLSQSSKELETLKLFFKVKILFLQGVLPKEFFALKILKNPLKDHAHFKMDKEQKKRLLKQLDEVFNRYISM